MTTSVITTRVLPRPAGIVLPYEVVGPADAPLVVVLGGISATRHVTASAGDPTPGWWSSVVGAGRVIDTTRLRVLSFDYLDGGRAPDGRPAAIVTTDDQAHALAALLDALQIHRAHAVVGASYGGMVSLSFAALYPPRLDRLVVIGSAHESRPMTTALRALQRRVVELGLVAGREHEAMVIARGIAMTTYRTAEEFDARFEREPTHREVASARFDVERYLTRAGHRFADAFTPARFLALSLSCDLHRVDPAAIVAPTLLVAAEGDAVVPPEQVEELARLLTGDARVERLRTIHGHDAFLCEPAAIGRLLTSVLLQPATI